MNSMIVLKAIKKKYNLFSNHKQNLLSIILLISNYSLTIIIQKNNQIINRIKKIKIKIISLSQT